MPRREPKAPAEPSSAKAGSPEKIRILRERFARREELWHEDDTLQRIDDDDEPPPRTPPVYSLRRSPLRRAA